MIPNASEIERRRLTVRSVLRLAGLFFIFLTLIPISSWLAEGIADGDLFELSYYADRIAIAVLFVILAATLLLGERLLVRFLVPIQRNARCPACRYRIEGVETPICTECGLQLTDEFLGRPRTSPVNHSYGYQIESRRAIVVAILRVFGLLYVLYCVLSLLGTLVMFAAFFIDSSSMETLSILVATLYTLLNCCFAYFLLSRSNRLARFAVPYRADVAAMEHEPPTPS